MRQVAMALAVIGILVSATPAQAGNCRPDSGFEWCYEYPNPWSSTPKLQVDIDYNTTTAKGYKVSQGSYTMRFKCSGTLYYGSNSCWYGGCNGQSLGGGVSSKSIASAYAAKPKMAEIRCYTQSGGGWAYAGYNPWTSNVYVVHCYNDNHCAACKSCSSSGAPSNWQCKLDSESCNGKDDDCDGSTDENWADLGQPCTAGVGECKQAGTKVCNAQGTGTKCSVSGGQPASEKCDAKDNDCDGSTDEDFDKGDACSVGVGECIASGVKVCKTDLSGTKCSATPLPAKTETCDGKDNDCNGVADNGYELGVACTVGVGECQQAGVTVCKDDHTGTKCDATALPPAAELCDAKDNDCDGSADEDFDEGTACTVGVGACTNTGLRVCTNDGSGTECDVSPHPAEDELCDGQDNDCDGESDEDFELAKPCLVGVGECLNLGLTICANDGLDTVCDVEPLPSQPESCDGKDNDCDGLTDEDFDVADLCQVGVGECKNTGVKQCTDDGAGTECSAAPLPAIPELCDGKDNDCDGAADNGFAVGQECVVGIGACANAGQLICTGDGLDTVCSVEPLQPGTELCDAIDNDCDGETDEAFVLEELCVVGLGECAVEGVTVCRPDTLGTECSAEPMPPAQEVCDSQDNDCDGAVDNGYPLGDACEVGVGECVAEGALICSEDGLGTQCDAQPLEPQNELCDGLDNDCDEESDEGFPLGELCAVGIGECVAAGIEICAPDSQGTVCNAIALAPQGEVCDGLDNDCDGAIDNGYPLGELCLVGVGECVSQGSRICAENEVATICSVDPLQPSVELCDGLDNDCDGQVDNGFQVGEECQVGVGECLATGALVCTDDAQGTFCDVLPGDPTVELCDGLDNDCDSLADEDFPVGADCQVGIGQCVADGKRVCTGDGSGTLCSASPGEGQDEWCDGLDNDCDGLVDEDYPLGEECIVGIGECVNWGLFGCAEAGDSVQCETAPLAPAAELCDGLDNDCDDGVDEDFPGLGALCHAGKGSCLADGERVCGEDGNSLMCDAVPLTPTVEKCNLVDDDCDGTVDEFCPCIAGDKRPCGPSLGECEPGVQLCEDGAWGPCLGQAKPGPEVCDGLDNDCDGVTDPGCTCAAGETEACGLDEGICEPGSRSCIDGFWGGCEGGFWPGVEFCDDLDNDCDGMVDEGFPGLYLPCSKGIGGCQAEGLLVCNAQGLGVVCDAVAGLPADELCNSVDDDCDGEADEAPACFQCVPGQAEACTPDSGDCGLGTRVCLEDGSWGECEESAACGDLVEAEVVDEPELVDQPDVAVEQDYEVVEQGDVMFVDETISDLTSVEVMVEVDAASVDLSADAGGDQQMDVGGDSSTLFGDGAAEVDGAELKEEPTGAPSGGCTTAGRPALGSLLALLLLAALLAGVRRRERPK